MEWSSLLAENCSKLLVPSALGKSYFMIEMISFQTSTLLKLQIQIQRKAWEKVSRVTWMQDSKNLLFVIKAVAGPHVLA